MRTTIEAGLTGGVVLSYTGGGNAGVYMFLAEGGDVLIGSQLYRVQSGRVIVTTYQMDRNMEVKPMN